MFAFSAPTLLLLLSLSASFSPAEAGGITIVGPCSAVPGATVEFRIIASFEETFVVGAYQTDVLFDPSLLSISSYSAPVDGPFEHGTYSHLDSPGTFSAAGISCTTTPPRNSIVLGKIRFKVIGHPGATARISVNGTTFLTSLGVFKGVSALPAFMKIVAEADRDCDGTPDRIDNCPNVYNPTQSDRNLDGHGDACDAREDHISSFTATGQGGNIIVSWSTSTEPGIVGFHLSRSMASDGPWEDLGKALIPARGSPLAGATYTYKDKPPGRPASVFYHLMAVDTTGRLTVSDPIQIILRREPRTGDRVKVPESTRPGSSDPVKGGKP